MERDPNTHHVVVIGGGFAGLNAAKQLAGREGFTVSLYDQRNHHLFQPLLYQVATAGLNPSDIAVPIRAQFSDEENVYVHLAKVDGIDLANQRVNLAGHAEPVPYDFLVVACGAQHSYFGKAEWEPFAPGLKTLEQATEIRRRILLAFEEAENENDAAKQAELLTFVVVGGGPTGVELSGAIADISRTVMVKDFRRIDPAKTRVVLMEAGPRILASFPETLTAQAQRDLTALGVELRLGVRVELIDPGGVVAGGERIAARNVFWAAGVQASRLDFVPEVDTDRAGRVKVSADFSIPGFPTAYVIGDMAALDLGNGQMLPGLAPVAIQAGRYVAKRILTANSGKPFHYVDKGQMATIGKHKAIASAGWLRMTGFLAWTAWLFVHVFYLIGFKNRFSVMAQWTWNYLFSRRGARLITERDWRLKN